MTPTIPISNDSLALMEQIKGIILDPAIALLNASVDKLAIDLALYFNGSLDNHLLADLTTQCQAAREFPLTQPMISQLIKAGRLKTYTEVRLVRRSEIKHYLETKSKPKPKPGMPKIPK